ncbi:hypothetical protein [Streptomyces sp. NPDC094032]|uniref:hypothetical protein n=1 Tax=Streptomyces sp. NPDC094032 TaxID=3155308 RepID=UPI003327047C
MAPPETVPAPAPAWPDALADDAASVIAPHVVGLRGPRRVMVVALTLACGLVAGAAGWWVGHSLDNVSAVDTARHEDDGQRAVDRARQPVEVSTAYVAQGDYDPATFPGEWQIVLDKPLSAETQRALTAIRLGYGDDGGASRKVWELLRPLGGRVLAYQPAMSKTPPHFTTGGTVTSIRLGLESLKSAPVNIDDISADAVTCVPADAAVVVSYPPAGDSPVKNLALDLSGRSKVLLVEDEEGGRQGTPYFQGASVALGQNQTGSNLRIDAITQHETCTFTLKASYRVAGEAPPSAPLEILDKGVPFKAEGRPAHPVQHFELSWSLPSNGRKSGWTCAGSVEPGICEVAPWL